MVTATLKNYRQSPRKVRVVANLIKGKKVDIALNTLELAGKRAASPLKRLLASAIANAKNQSLDDKNLIVKSIRVDGGVVLKRMMPRARGRGFAIKKRTCHVMITLEENNTEKK
jgi:large subunit ribosomal protein L22